jgi:peptidylprolyl isomerase
MLNVKTIKTLFSSIVFIFAFIVLWQEVRLKKLNAKLIDVPIENLIYLKLKDGIVVIETFPNIAPKHIEHIKTLVRQGFYDGNKFFRVIDGFVAQTGDPTGTGRGGSGTKLEPEFSKISHKRGIVSMARANDLASADSQFFIVLADSEFLDGKYTVWGRVVSGMEFVDEIKKAKTGSNGIVSEPDIIISMALAKDVQKQVDKNFKKTMI